MAHLTLDTKFLTIITKTKNKQQTTKQKKLSKILKYLKNQFLLSLLLPLLKPRTLNMSFSTVCRMGKIILRLSLFHLWYAMDTGF